MVEYSYCVLKIFLQVPPTTVAPQSPVEAITETNEADILQSQGFDVVRMLNSHHKHIWSGVLFQ